MRTKIYLIDTYKSCNMIGKLIRVPLREVWKHEALEFTRWLQDNIEVLNDVCNLSLSNAEREQDAGSFNVDLVAEDEDGNTVVIENQLEKSNHEHIGKLLTYLTAYEAKKAIWIVADARPEHTRAITWLNESSSAEFYLLKVEAVRIDESSPAPLLTLIVGPSEEGREVGMTKKEIAERYGLREKFWTELLNQAKEKTKLHANISPSESSWISAGAGRSGLGYYYTVREHEGAVELNIDRGKDLGNENRIIFEKLAESKKEIESSFGETLEWDVVEGRRMCRIRKKIRLGGYRDPEKWPHIQDEMIDAMIRLERALKPHITKLQI